MQSQPKLHRELHLDRGLTGEAVEGEHECHHDLIAIGPAVHEELVEHVGEHGVVGEVEEDVGGLQTSVPSGHEEGQQQLRGHCGASRPGS